MLLLVRHVWGNYDPRRVTSGGLFVHVGFRVLDRNPQVLLSDPQRIDGWSIRTSPAQQRHDEPVDGFEEIILREIHDQSITVNSNLEGKCLIICKLPCFRNRGTQDSPPGSPMCRRLHHRCTSSQALAISTFG